MATFTIAAAPRGGCVRIGSAEIEDCLAAHPDVAGCGVVGAPDADCGQAVTAPVWLHPGIAGDAALDAVLSAHVTDRPGAYRSPRRIAFPADLPLTSLGKASRRALRAELDRIW
jgi:2-aminobenzoate-CoA ligase